MKTLYILILFSIFYLDSHAQEFQSFDRQKWKEITRDIDYSEGSDKNTSKYDQSGNKGKQRGEMEEQAVSEHNSGGWSLFPFGGPFFQMVMIVLFIALLVFIISKLVGNNIKLNKKTQNGKGAVSIEDLEEKLMESDLLTWLKKAVGDKDYKLALRIYYLMIIKELSGQGIIQWKKEKTNLEYLMEMRDHTGHGKFEKITSIYHLIWYGDKEMGESYLITASHTFKDFFQSLSGGGHE